MATAQISENSGINDMLVRLASGSPLSTAVITDTGEYSFGQLHVAARETARKLRPGSRVLTRLGNNVASVTAIHAVWTAGCSIVSASTMVPDSEVDRRINETGASFVLTPSGTGLDIDVERTDYDHTVPPEEAAVMFTSGTTGAPKGASLTFAALRGSLAGIAGGNGLPPDGRPPTVPPRAPQLVIVPIAHMGGLLSVLTSWWLGKPVLIREKFSPEMIFELVERFRLGVLRLTPAMVWDMTRINGASSLPGVASVTVGTAALPDATRLAFEEKYSIPVLRNYGQTEFAGAIAFERPDDIAAGIRPANTVGRIAPGVEVMIVDPDGNPLATGEVGEITARAASSMSGYLDSTGNPVDPGAWLCTGDLGKVDDHGFVYVVGRVRDMLVCGGFNVYPAQIEAALNGLAEVADSAVTGIPDDRLGEVPVAAVVLHPGRDTTPEDLRTALRARLAAYELPRKVAITEHIPRLETGKVDRPRVAGFFTGSS